VDRAVAAARYAFEEGAVPLLFFPHAIILSWLLMVNVAGEWSQLSAKQRGDLLYRLAELIEQEKESLSLLGTISPPPRCNAFDRPRRLIGCVCRTRFRRTESLDVGKPVFESLNFDLKQVVDTYRYFAVSFFILLPKSGRLRLRLRLPLLSFSFGSWP
jgi:hypothetical protein